LRAFALFHSCTREGRGPESVCDPRSRVRVPVHIVGGSHDRPSIAVGVIDQFWMEIIVCDV